jgi:D-beta-D-heptose 7-phosphate kinase/D-beta-D-heptose 1-phosphate adenosyltransferase
VLGIWDFGLRTSDCGFEISHFISNSGEDGETMMNAAEKVLDRNTLKEKVDSLRQAEKRVVFTNGCFDLIHIGHIRLLQQAREKGDFLVVAVNSDSSVKQIKEPGRPVMPEGERAEVVAALGCVDWVTIFAEPDPLVLIRLLKPDVLVKGTDWSEEEIVGAPDVIEAGGQVLRIQLEPGISTSALIKRIRST